MLIVGTLVPTAAEAMSKTGIGLPGPCDNCSALEHETAEPGRYLPGTAQLILCHISLLGCCRFLSRLANVSIRAGSRLGRICRLLRPAPLLTEEHHAAGQDDQERHHEKKEDLSIGHSNGLSGARDKADALSTILDSSHAGQRWSGMRDCRPS
jgi:hypothetical protein